MTMGSKDRLTMAVAVLGDIACSDAELVVDYYITLKIAKYGFDGSSLNVTHGSFLDREVIRRALSIVNGEVQS